MIRNNILAKGLVPFMMVLACACTPVFAEENAMPVVNDEISEIEEVAATETMVEIDERYISNAIFAPGVGKYTAVDIDGNPMEITITESDEPYQLDAVISVKTSDGVSTEKANLMICLPLDMNKTENAIMLFPLFYVQSENGTYDGYVSFDRPSDVTMPFEDVPEVEFAALGSVTRGVAPTDFPTVLLPGREKISIFANLEFTAVETDDTANSGIFMEVIEGIREAYINAYHEYEESLLDNINACIPVVE